MLVMANKTQNKIMQQKERPKEMKPKKQAATRKRFQHFL